MENKYEVNSKIFKALSDPNRLKIIDILSYGEVCGCKILNYFKVTQPTLSHHMRVLIDSGLVKARKEGTWNHYSLVDENTNKLVEFLKEITIRTEKCENDDSDCICEENKILKNGDLK